MAEQLFSIDLGVLDSPDQDDPVASERSPVAARSRRPPITARWLDAGGTPIGRAVRIRRPKTVRIETTRPGGGYGHVEISPPALLEADPPEGAQDLLVRAGGRQSLIANVTAARSRLPDPARKRFGAANPKVRMTVVAERFPAEAAFHVKVQELLDWIRLQPPFNEQAIGPRLGMEALFWASDPANGLFETGDRKAATDEQLFHGDRELAARLLKRHVDLDGLVVILINSAKRGGAGGSKGHASWASIAQRAGEDWQAVVLHEVGHALGLADEYLDRDLANRSPPGRLEPNVTRKPRAGDAPWAARNTVPAQLSPSHTLQAQAASAFPGVIGTFQGARYREDLFRPASDCLMRSTRAKFAKSAGTRSGGA